MNIINTSELSSNQFYDAKTLIELCRLTDNTKGICFLENNVNAIENFPAFFLMYQGNTLVSFLSVFVPNEEECEIYANTLPRYRQEGYFRKLYEMAQEQIKNYGISKIYFVNEPNCLAGSEALGRLGAKLETSEYLMSYNMRIYNLEIESRYRGRRFGVETLNLTVKHLREINCCKIILHVSGSNRIAYRMYSHHGFVHVEQVDYWLKRV